jgi:uncharacterized membrane protein
MKEFLKSDDAKRLIVVAGLLLWCVFLIAVRFRVSGSGYYLFLYDNLFLACLPLILSTALRFAHRLKWHVIFKCVLFGLWLLFLPNAPYIMTDIVHLNRAPHGTAWFDLAMLLSCSGTGLLVGYLSLADVQGMVARRFSSLYGWIFALVSLVLSGFAIYIGRFLRWNSWDILIDPMRIFTAIGTLLHPLTDTRPLSVTMIFSVILAFGYISLRILLVQPGSRTEELSGESCNPI